MLKSKIPAAAAASPLLMPDHLDDDDNEGTMMSLLCVTVVKMFSSLKQRACAAAPCGLSYYRKGPQSDTAKYRLQKGCAST